MLQAFWMSGKFIFGATKMIIHGIYPDVFTEAASDTAKDILRKTHPGMLKKEK